MARLLHVAPRFPPAEGGGERHVARLTAELNRLDYAVTVVTTKLTSEVPLRVDPALPDEQECEGVDVVRLPVRATGLPVWGYGFTIPHVRDHVAALRPDLVHVHGYGYRFGDVLARRGRGDWPLVMTSHGFLPGRGLLRPLKRLYDGTWGRGTVRRLDAAIALSPRDRDVFEALGAGRCEVVPNGVDAARFVGAAPDARLLDWLGLEQRRYLVTVGRLERLKGQDLLLRAFARLAQERPELRLVLVGEGRSADKLGKLASRLSLLERVRFAGRLSDRELAALLAGALALVHTPRDEPFGLVLLEGMAASVPVLATRVGGIPFAVGDAALLCDARPSSIAAGLTRLLDDDALRTMLVERGRVRAASLSWEANAARVDALYRELLDSRPRG